VANTIVSSLPSAEVVSVNDAGGAGGFDFRDVEVDPRGRQQYRQGPGAYAVLAQDTNHFRRLGNEHRIALLSRRRTDVLLADIQQWPAGVFADPQTPVGRAAWYSLAFYLRVAAAAELDVDTLELESGFRTYGPPGQPLAQAFLTDKLENGAGYCRWLADVDPHTNRHRFELLLDQANPTHPNSIAQRWVVPAPGHAGDCDTSCNACLRDFYNLPYHGLLDWRLALDMARVLTSANVTIDLMTPWGGVPNPWGALVVGTPGNPGVIPMILNRLGYGPRVPIGPIWGYVNPHRQVVLIECHPLWTLQHPLYSAALQDVAVRYPGYADVRAMNPFLVIRRPAEYV